MTAGAFSFRNRIVGLLARNRRQSLGLNAQLLKGQAQGPAENLVTDVPSQSDARAGLVRNLDAHVPRAVFENVNAVLRLSRDVAPEVDELVGPGVLLSGGHRVKADVGVARRDLGLSAAECEGKRKACQTGLEHFFSFAGTLPEERLRGCVIDERTGAGAEDSPEAP